MVTYLTIVGLSRLRPQPSTRTLDGMPIGSSISGRNMPEFPISIVLSSSGWYWKISSEGWVERTASSEPKRRRRQETQEMDKENGSGWEREGEAGRCNEEARTYLGVGLLVARRKVRMSQADEGDERTRGRDIGGGRKRGVRCKRA